MGKIVHLMIEVNSKFSGGVTTFCESAIFRSGITITNKEENVTCRKCLLGLDWYNRGKKVRQNKVVKK